MKYHLITYGCQMNTADSEEMAQPLRAKGLTATADLHQADIVLMNTCTVRDQAEHRAQSNIGRLRPWKEKDPNRILIIAGCAASRWGDSIKKRYPYIDAVSPATQIEQFPELVDKILKERWNFDEENQNAFGDEEKRVEARGVKDAPASVSPIASLPSPFTLFGDTQTAYVTIMRGCNYTCSYCIVPQVRGREMYRPLSAILAEIEERTAQGYREIMLLGQTVNSYHDREETGDVDFADLLRLVNALPGVERIRFMSPHPRHMRERVITAMAESPKVCRHIHLPVQSGSDRILGRMKRLYTRDEYVVITQRLRAAMPGLLMTTDLIVGYPGETEEDLEATLSLMEEIKFDGLFAFKFSTRPGTPAAQEVDDVPASVKEERLQAVLALNRRLVQENALWPN